MLKNLSSLHTPELLHALASMGHCDEILIADANLPAVSMAQRLVRLDGIGSSAALEAVLRLIPLNSSWIVLRSVWRWLASRHEIPEVQQEFQKIIDQAEGRHVALVRMEGRGW